jgi:F0F1-type ATP synthase epsilon subunit
VSRERVTVLADTAEFSHEIDPDRAEQTLARARELLGSVNETPNRAELAASVQRAKTDCESRAGRQRGGRAAVKPTNGRAHRQ